jgi:hypothetical protein
VWIPGDDPETRRDECRISPIATDEGKWALDIFPGRGETTEALRSMGYKIFTLDSLPSSNVDVTADLSDWEYRTFSKGTFEVIYVRLHTGGDPEEPVQRRVQAVMSIIEYFEPQCWVVQIPQESFVTRLEIMQDIPQVEVDACPFGERLQAPFRCYGSQTIGFRRRSKGGPRTVLSYRKCPRILLTPRDGVVCVGEHDGHGSVHVDGVEATPEESSLQEIYDALRGRVHLGKPMLLGGPQEHP